MLDPILEKFQKEFSFKELEDNEYRSFKVSGMKFEVTGYEVEGIGRASLMNASGMAGLMKMSTLMINPLDVDAPLYSVDIIKAMGNNMLIVEMYDTCLEQKPDEAPFKAIGEKYAHLADMPKEERWYDSIRFASSIAKKVGSKEAKELNAITEEFSNAYLELLRSAVSCDRAAKLEKARAYSHGLIEHGGTAADNFLKNWGKEKTQDFFDKVLFG
jgi:hypothetical protein